MAAKDVEKAEQQGLAEFFKLTSKINTSNMICFDLDGKIKKYNSPEEIIEDFYPKRLAYYQKRKVPRRLFFSLVSEVPPSNLTGFRCRTSSRTNCKRSSRSCRTRHAS